MLEDPIWFDPAYARTSFLPITNANLDLGSSSLFFRSLFLNTSLVFNGSSNVFKINANTVDGSDNKRLSIGSGGDTLATRGAWALFNGNEFASDPGQVFIICGDVSGSGLTFRMSTFGNSFVNFQNGSASTVLSITQTGTISYNNANFRIASITTDGADNQGAFFCGGGSNTVSRGAVVFIGGNEYSGSNGTLSLSAGDASNAFVTINAPSAVSPTIRFSTTGSERWRVSSTSFIGMDTTTSYIFRINDSGFIAIGGGTSTSTSAGSTIQINGITGGANVGAITLTTSNVATGHVIHLVTNASARHRFYIGGVEHISFRDATLFQVARASLQSTGAGAALLGANCPSAFLSAPYTWVTVTAFDGTPCIIPMWRLS